ncbi:hypothetical protein BDQ17DRAFT_1329289 [Cyathus striatus]|nr:hypothetical protein BDQ17DRAFT_1329289 [Cyathus striatus]
MSSNKEITDSRFRLIRVSPYNLVKLLLIIDERSYFDILYISRQETLSTTVNPASISGLYFYGYIPLEIVELIINEVALVDDQNTFPTLKACKLASSIFLEPSRRYIFKEIKLIAPTASHNSYIRGSAKYRRLQDILVTSPQLAFYARSFHLQDNFTRHSFLSQPTLPNLLGMFQNITSFNWTFTTEDNDIVASYDWRSSSPTLQQALMNIMFSPIIEIVSLRFIKNLPHAFGRYFANIPTVQAISSTPGRCLRSLTIADLDLDKCQPLIDGLSSSNFRLEELKLDSYTPRWVDDNIIAAAITNTHRNTLTRIEFPCRVLPQRLIIFYLKDEIAILNIGMFPRLQTVKIYSHYDEQDPFGSATDILKKARNPNEIREIIIEIEYRLIYILQTRSALLRSQRFDKLLCEVPFSRLEKVHLTVEPWKLRPSGQHSGSDIARMVLENSFPEANRTVSLP